MQIHLASTKKVYKITSKGSYAKFLNGKVYYAYGDFIKIFLQNNKYTRSTNTIL